ncbi:MAG: Unknown protein [uncultured Sulfurovum sp.]|uniref:Caspase family p20 domain-containing protein n=1 Tax=uncultured Sulfurovum sp. TaxID=269237 RepID=A0A6S6RS68_9BACT|nr:MAG: Unknown protein [uncultured Sulfurovum sp.]
MFLFIIVLTGCYIEPKVQKVPINRVALVIGNQDYRGNTLKNPISDAIGIKETLENIGFDVTLLLDSTLDQLNETLEGLKGNIEANNTLVFIYFAGHGNTLHKNSSEQFLMMTDKDRPTLVSIFKFYDFLKKVKARHSIIALDVCRDYQEHYIVENEKLQNKNNFRGNFSLEGFRGTTIRYDDGVKEDVQVFVEKEKYSYKLPPSTLVSYATERNQRAKDYSLHDDGHGAYTYALMKYLDDEEIPIGEVFRRVRVSILEESNRQQVSSEIMGLEKNIWLVPKKAPIAFSPPI